MGEKGISRTDFLYRINFMEAQRLMRGFGRRNADMWSAIRWMTFNVMAVMPYVDLKKACIRNPSDLIRFPWDNIDADETGEGTIVSDEEIQRMQQMMREENERLKNAGK